MTLRINMIPNLYYSLIYNLSAKILKAPGFVTYYALKKYKILLNKKKNTPIISLANKQLFFCPLNHQLLFHQNKYPLYDRQLSKLCKFIHRAKGNLSIIDIGANIGDTVLNIGIKNAYYLCIEGNTKFARYIKYNLRNYHYSLEYVYLSDTEDNKGLSVNMSNGTSHLVNTDELENEVPLITLDKLLNTKYPNQKFDLIKIDTDGFDFKVIRGSIEYLKKMHPLLFFEWDKIYCQEQNENPLSIFPVLEEMNYSYCILFDNFGNPISIIKTNDTQTLYTHIKNTVGDNLPYYYDVLAIPDSDNYNIENIYNLFK